MSHIKGKWLDAINNTGAWHAYFSTENKKMLWPSPQNAAPWTRMTDSLQVARCDTLRRAMQRPHLSDSSPTMAFGPGRITRPDAHLPVRPGSEQAPETGAAHTDAAADSKERGEMRRTVMLTMPTPAVESEPHSSEQRVWLKPTCRGQRNSHPNSVPTAKTFRREGQCSEYNHILCLFCS